MSLLNTVGIAAAILCPLAVTAFAVLVVFALSGKQQDLPLFVRDETPLEDEPQWTDVTEVAQDVPVGTEPAVVTLSPAPPPEGWVEFRGGLVHIRCLGPKLLNDAPPCAGCAVHLDHVLTGAS
ncbi:MAG TPA: hypothetical protein VNC22_21560 [Sporichthya sp.]|nr:hypothetical protein [Sporichthya sp.]